MVDRILHHKENNYKRGEVGHVSLTVTKVANDFKGDRTKEVITESLNMLERKFQLGCNNRWRKHCFVGCAIQRTESGHVTISRSHYMKGLRRYFQRREGEYSQTK